VRDGNAYYLGTPRQEVMTAGSGLPKILIQKGLSEESSRDETTRAP